jgi:hypothetical protein
MRRSLIHVFLLTGITGCVEPICERDPSQCPLRKGDASIVRIGDRTQLSMSVWDIPPDASLLVRLSAGEKASTYRPGYLKYTLPPFEGRIENTPAAIAALHQGLAQKQKLDPAEVRKTRFDVCVPLPLDLLPSQLSSAIEPISEADSPLGSAAVFMLNVQEARRLIDLKPAGSVVSTGNKHPDWKVGSLGLNENQLSLLRVKKGDGEAAIYQDTLRVDSKGLKSDLLDSILLANIKGLDVRSDFSAKRALVLQGSTTSRTLGDCGLSPFMSCEARTAPATASALALGPSGDLLAVFDSKKGLQLAALPEQADKATTLPWKAVPSSPASLPDDPVLLASGSSLLLAVHKKSKKTFAYRWLDGGLLYEPAESERIKGAIQAVTGDNYVGSLAVGRLADGAVEDVIVLATEPRPSPDPFKLPRPMLMVLASLCDEQYIAIQSVDLSVLFKLYEKDYDSVVSTALAIGQGAQGKRALVAAGTTVPSDMNKGNAYVTYFQAWFP